MLLRTWSLSALALLLLGGLSVWILIASLEPTPGTNGGVDGTDIRGRVDVAEGLADRVAPSAVLFVLARTESGELLGVVRIPAPRFPVVYRIGPEDVMMQGGRLTGRVALSARLSQSGQAGPAEAGDLEGEHPGRVGVGSRDVNLTLTRVR